MLRRAIISLMAIFLVFNSINAFSAQYENYKWGISKQKAINQVQKNGYNITANWSLDDDKEVSIHYEDKLFNNEISVSLLFTPKTKKLCAISIISEETSVGRDLKPILIDKYGEPTKVNEYSEKYAWSESGDITIRLEYVYETNVFYYADKYWDIYKKEKQELQKKEAGDKF